MPKLKTLSVDVKRRHIKEGTPENANSCALALACNELIGVKTATVDGYAIELQTNENGIDIGAGNFVGTLTIPSSKRIANFVKAFDSGRKVKPATFRLV